jgi:hypothetical protein
MNTDETQIPSAHLRKSVSICGSVVTGRSYRPARPMITRLTLVAICLFFGIGILIAPYSNGLQTGHLVVAAIFLIAAWVILQH